MTENLYVMPPVYLATLEWLGDGWADNKCTSIRQALGYARLHSDWMKRGH